MIRDQFDSDNVFVLGLGQDELGYIKEEGGEVRYPVEEVTIAGNLLTMFRGIVAVGRDVLVRGSKQTGSILVDRMTIAGD